MKCFYCKSRIGFWDKWLNRYYHIHGILVNEEKHFYEEFCRNKCANDYAKKNARKFLSFQVHGSKK